MRTILCLVLLLGIRPFPALAEGGEPSPASRPPELKQALDVTVSVTIAVEVLKRTFQEPRPEGSGLSGYAFPSGEAALAWTSAGVPGKMRTGSAASILV